MDYLNDDETFFLTLGEAKKRLGRQKWLVKGVVPADSTGLLFGESGSYKTFMALDLALRVAHGLEWVERKTMKGAVCYVAAEGGLSIMKRIDAWHKYHELDQAKAEFYLCPEPILLDDSVQLQMIADSIVRRCKNSPPALIVIDTLSQCMRGEEDSNTDVSNLLSSIVSELRVCCPGCSVLLIHHPGHSDKKRMRGASALRANTDFVLQSEKGRGNRVAITLIKIKDGELSNPLSFRLEKIELDPDEDNEPASSLVAVFESEGPPHSGSIKLNTPYRSAIITILNDDSPLSEHDLKEKAVKEIEAKGGSPKKDSIAKGVGRAINDLLGAGMVSKNPSGFLFLKDDSQ